VLKIVILPLNFPQCALEVLTTMCHMNPLLTSDIDKWGIFSRTFSILETNFRTRTKFFNKLILRGRGNCPPSPLCHDIITVTCACWRRAAMVSYNVIIGDTITKIAVRISGRKFIFILLATFYSLKVKGRLWLLMITHLRATERHVPHGITQCYLQPNTGERALP